MNSKPIVGFISPPDWLDPTPNEFRDCVHGRVDVQQTMLDLPNFDWHIDSIAETKPRVIRAAQQLSNAGCSLIANVGTPFGWAGLKDISEARTRNRQISDASGATVISTASAIFRTLDEWSVKTVALACTYYITEWRDRWSDFVTASGIEVVAAQTMADQGIMNPHGSDDTDYWAPTAGQIVESVAMLADANPAVEAIVITGAGSRTHSIRDKLLTLTDAEVIGADTSLYLNLVSKLGVSEVLTAVGE